MWKVVVRGIRETLERRVCRTNVYSQSSQDNAKNEVKTSLTCQQKFLPPVLITCDKGFCGSSKSTGANNSKHDSDWNTKHSWSEAVGWSSVLAAGWVVCQTLCLRKRVADRDSSETLKNKLHDYSSSILTQCLNLHPRKVLPVTNCTATSSKSSDLQDTESQWTAEKPFGPITIEEAFKNAAAEFTNTHNILKGECELRYGIKALEEMRYSDALMHFTAGAKLSSPGSLFNLGLCYELGVGTMADQAKAAKYYTDAAAHNHADALYNLGVYHAQGKGGLPIDIDTARTCFNKAASLGQVRAQCALDSEKAEVKSKKTLAPNTNQKELEKIGEHFMPFKLSDHTLYSNVDDTFGTTVKSDQGLMGIVDLIKPFKFNPPPPIMINADYYVPY
ncbi:PREDICTED: uncharacterized protein LOC105566188 isoform X1 [Vollenhovia emeryi]|uniref:uncharacterized protein LOC105566188 isoform X1 n=1 Tax=Vollenhovia emeryi TaxID=411798 RepID=UPI0005F57116|nr:PREDICTED: uncharacterized protein LOC105566188 isoform X1 [Vollenhovia emeryi]